MKSMEFPNINSARKNSEEKLELLRTKLEKFTDKDIEIIVSGSCGRLEATSGSDVDYFVLHSNSCDKDHVDRVVKEAREIVEKELKLPSAGGSFGDSVNAKTMLENIGGDEDDNKNITKRILFMTESRPIGSGKLYKKTLEKLIARYISDKITEHQIALFLLNDFIRFYRTMCVDFENKTFEKNKAWGIRNIKLIFSRKLIYFGGVLIVAETSQLTPKRKKEVVSELCLLSPLERLEHLFGDRAVDVLRHYDQFLGYLNDKDIRKEFEGTPADRSKHSELFRCAKNDGHHFSDALIALLNSKYSFSHPIHRSLIL